MLPASAPPESSDSTTALILQSEALTAFPRLRHGFSTRTCGNLASRYGLPTDVVRARRRFAHAVDVDPDRVSHYALTHSSRVGLVSEMDTVPIDTMPHRISIRRLLADAGKRDVSFTNPQGVNNQQGIDSLITTTPDVALFMVVGDSAPVLLAAPRARGIAMAHVGIVGTVNHVLEYSVRSLCQVAECRASEITAVIGPTIGPCCYALAQSMTWGKIVSRLFFDEYGPQGPGVVMRKDQYFFDLPAAITDDLRRQGLLSSMIHAMNMCTACADSPFFSQRAGVAGRFGALFALSDG